MVRARKGDKLAQAIVAEEFDPTYPLNVQAQGGDVEAWLAWYALSNKDADSVKQALEIVCEGARQDEGDAQLFVAELMTESRWRELGKLRRDQLLSAGFFPANVFAYFWYRQAARNGVAAAETRLADLTAAMDEDEIAMAELWRFDPLTVWERDRFWNAMSPSPAQATKCPVSLTDPKDRQQMNQLRNAALVGAGDPRAAARLGDVGALEHIAAGGDAEAAAILAIEHDDPKLRPGAGFRGRRRRGILDLSSPADESEDLPTGLEVAMPARDVIRTPGNRSRG